MKGNLHDFLLSDRLKAARSREALAYFTQQKGEKWYRLPELVKAMRTYGESAANGSFA